MKLAEYQKDRVRKIVLPRLDGKLERIAEKNHLRKEEDLVNHLLRRRKNLMQNLEEY